MGVRRRDLFLPGLVATLPLRAPGQQPERLEIGLLPNLSARVLLTQYEPLVTYLVRELAVPVQASTAVNWATFQRRTVELSYDLVVTAANLARLAQLDAGWLPLLCCKPDIRALFVCAAARPLADAAALRGSRLVLANPQSLVALRGLDWLAERGLQRGRDYELVATPTDDSVGHVLVRGDAGGAVLSGGEFRAIPEAVRSQLQVVSTFAELPGFVLMASPRLDAVLRRRLHETLLRFGSGSEEGRQFFQRTGFQALVAVEPGLMDGLQGVVEATRRALQG